ncbi:MULTISPECIES: hypothetical protein [Methylobacterium]|nr:hypothetical protein [Methylobacterium sp. DB0501]NGM36048.1 hypothetical protein [Methylobacterium sp. DB0501]
MSETLFALLDIGLVFGPVLGFAFWQLRVLRRDKRKAAGGRPKREG